MEYALEDFQFYENNKGKVVLILVLMEYALEDVSQKHTSCKRKPS